MRRKVFLLILSALVLFGLWNFIKPSPTSVKEPTKVIPSIVVSKEFVTIVAAGDIACESSRQKSDTQCQQTETASVVTQINPDAVLALGDLQYGSGSLEDFQKSYDTSWGKFKDITFPALGNHEYGVGDAAGYFKYFGDKAQSYYSFGLGKWHLVALNSNCWATGGCETNSSQYKWLENDLKNSNSLCTLAFWHHPLFSSGQHGNNLNMTPLWQLLQSFKADVILSGHDHIYERFKPQNIQGQPTPDGMREFIVGTGGRNLYSIEKVLPTSEIRINDRFGVLKLNLKKDSYSWEFISTDNQMLDQGGDSCH